MPLVPNATPEGREAGAHLPRNEGPFVPEKFAYQGFVIHVYKTRPIEGWRASVWDGNIIRHVTVTSRGVDAPMIAQAKGVQWVDDYVAAGGVATTPPLAKEGE